MGKYDPDSDTFLRWPVGSGSPSSVEIYDLGTEVSYPWSSWTGYQGARIAAESPGAWDTWNLTIHPDPAHRAWFAAQLPVVRARLRQRALMIAGYAP